MNATNVRLLSSICRNLLRQGNVAVGDLYGAPARVALAEDGIVFEGRGVVDSYTHARFECRFVRRESDSLPTAVVSTPVLDANLATSQATATLAKAMQVVQQAQRN